MTLIFTVLSLVAALGIGAILLRYHRAHTWERLLSVFKFKGEDFWIKLIKMRPKSAFPYKGLARWYAKKGSKEYAIRTLKYANKLNPKDKKIEKMLVKLKEKGEANT